MFGFLILFVFAVISTSALPTDQVLHKDLPDVRGQLFTADIQPKTGDSEPTRYNPRIHDTYHLFTRKNPIVSQPLVLYEFATVWNSNFNPNQRTIVILHGWFGYASATYNVKFLLAFLAREDVNVIIVDWGEGAETFDYITAIINSIKAARHAALFINWLNSVTGVSSLQYYIMGFSLGGHMAGMVARHVEGPVGIVMGLDPANGWSTIDHRFQPTDGVYTEVIHTGVGGLGTEEPLAQVDVYPNGGSQMPHCGDTEGCDHDAVYDYFVESIRYGGFTAMRCDSSEDALNSGCNSTDTIQMGGLYSKFGTTGIFFLETNEEPPYSQG